MPADFSDSAISLFIRVKFEDDLPSGGNIDRFAEERLAIFALKYLAQRGCADQYIVPVGKVVTEIALAVVEVWDARYDEFFGTSALLDEEIAIALAGDTEYTVSITEAGRRGSRQPARKTSEPLDEAKPDRFRVCNPFLNQHDPVVSNVLLQIHIRAGYNQIVRPMLPLIVDGKVMIVQIHAASFRQRVADNRKLHPSEPSKHLAKAIAVVWRKGVFKLAQMRGYLMHLSCLIHRPANK